MAKFHDLVLDGANPGATVGAVFTATIAEAQLIPKGEYLDHFIISLNGAVSTAAVTLESFVGLLSQFTFKVGQETRIQLNASDLIALMAGYYGRLPHAWEETSTTGRCFVFGIKVPVQETIDPQQKYAYSLQRTAVTNIGTETVLLDAVYMTKPSDRSPIVAVPSPLVTPGATGLTNPNIQVPPLGRLIGLLVFQTTIPTSTGITYDIQRLQLVLDGKLSSLLHAAGSDPLVGKSDYADLAPFGEVLNPYSYFDFKDDPIDLKAQKVQFNIDVEKVSEATRIIPIIEKV